MSFRRRKRYQNKTSWGRDVAITSVTVFLSAVFAALLSYWLSSSFAETERRDSNAREIVWRFFSSDMQRIRRSAYQGIKELSSKDASEIHPDDRKRNIRNLLEYIGKSHPNEQRDLEQLLSFFHSIHTSIENKHADPEIIISSLEPNFNEWLNCYLAAFLVDGLQEGIEWRPTRQSLIALKGMIRSPISQQTYINDNITSCTTAAGKKAE